MFAYACRQTRCWKRPLKNSSDTTARTPFALNKARVHNPLKIRRTQETSIPRELDDHLVFGEVTFPTFNNLQSPSQDMLFSFWLFTSITDFTFSKYYSNRPTVCFLIIILWCLSLLFHPLRSSSCLPILYLLSLPWYEFNSPKKYKITFKSYLHLTTQKNETITIWRRNSDHNKQKSCIVKNEKCIVL